jgi:glycosyltransferase involved in cell wall biosynthesis
MIAGMLRVKNEARWIERVLRSMQPVCERIFLLDDHSEDGTPFLAASLPGVTVYDSPYSGTDEVRDKNYLLEKVQDARPDYVLHLDGDEELAPGAVDVIRQIVAAPRAYVDAWRFRILYLWDREDQIRTDGIYENFRQVRMFRFVPGRRFIGNANGGNFHCGQAPQPYTLEDCRAKVLHYGYMHREDRLRKYEWYNRKDPGNEFEDRYRHMVLGDAPELPAGMRVKWGGPLKLEAL